MLAIETFTQRRYRCPFCRRSFASRGYAAKHSADCVRNPVLHGCSTCEHFLRTPCCAELTDDCGCKGKNVCKVGAFETWRFNDHDTHDPVEKGWWTHTEDYKREDCEQWSPVAPVDAP